MNFQGLGKVEDAQFYLDLALRRAREKVKAKKGAVHGFEPGKLKNLEILKIELVKNSLLKCLSTICSSFPTMDHLHPFYQELVKCSLDYVMLKQSLGAVHWAGGRIISMFRQYAERMRRSDDLKCISKMKSGYIGRVSSVMKQISPSLSYLEQARKVMKGFPALKTSVKTICIVGFPNVGKTTLLFRLTGSKPAIDSYPFTTKELNVGYIAKKVQLLDTPGTLNRPDKMNNIEKQAFIAMSKLAGELVYVFDLTEEYPLNDQLKLFSSLKALGKRITVYLSKTDILDRETVSAFVGKMKDAEIVTSAEELKQRLLAQKI